MILKLGDQSGKKITILIKLISIDTLMTENAQPLTPYSSTLQWRSKGRVGRLKGGRERKCHTIKGQSKGQARDERGERRNAAVSARTHTIPGLSTTTYTDVDYYTTYGGWSTTAYSSFAKANFTITTTAAVTAATARLSRG